MKVQISYGGKILSSNILIADDFFSRLVGLMFRKRPPADGLLIDPCYAIHTCFMRYSLDVVFLTKDNRIVKIIRHMKPWRHSWFYFRARKTLELPAGQFPGNLSEGDQLEVTRV